ncbi:MAG TPA: hypothetical protein VGP76_11450 [Planctomycetaceae bacterium]|jgi:hypothetical protein|nr:hypothetical protein [Planctomycetaceae bacterium]
MVIDSASLIFLPALALPLVILVRGLWLGATQMTSDEWMCVLTVPLTLDFMLGLARLFSRLPDFGIIPAHVVLLGLYAGIGFLVTLRFCVATKAVRLSQRIARVFGLTYFGIVVIVSSVAWMGPRFI